MRIAQSIFILLWIMVSPECFAQKPLPLPHGMVFGIRPAGIAAIDATKVEASMAKKTRITTAVRGKIIRITKPKGGWFEIDAGKGKIITAHFKNYNISIPKELRGRIVIIEGVAQKQFIADDMQHFAGDTLVEKKQHKVNTNPRKRLTFEVRGLIVDE